LSECPVFLLDLRPLWTFNIFSQTGVKLVHLHIAYNEADDLTPLKALTQLRSLSVRGYKLRHIPVDVNLFACLPNLTYLAIGSNSVTDIMPLTQLKQLRYLSLSNNKIEDITGLAQMRSLESLDLWYNRVSDLTPLAKLTNLQTLYLRGNPITDLTPISGLKNLKYLDISGDANGGEITDLTPIADLTNLEVLCAERNKIRNVRSLRKLTQLKRLWIEDNQITDVRPLRNLVKLTELRVSGNPITDITPLRTLLSRNPGLDIDGDLAQLSPVVASTGLQLSSIYWIDTDTGGFYRFLRSKTSIEQLSLGIPNITALAIDKDEGRIYWIEQKSASRSEIGVANLDGSQVQRVKHLYSLFHDIAIDPVNRKIYATNSNNRIQTFSSKRNSTFKAVSLLTNLDAPKHIALDVLGGKIYWTEAGERIRRANLDGTSVETLLTGTGTIGDISIGAQKLYWTEQTNENIGKIRRSNLDGTKPQTLTTLKSVPLGIAVDPTQRKLYWSNSAGKIQRANLNGKNIRSIIVDLGNPTDIVLDTEGTTSVAAAPNLYLPDSPALLPNYPNPFNPETWIPYQLAEPADVTLRISAANGVLVRTLTLGHRPAGIYQSRSRAAYWDGKNESGESVASGIYFYTISTNDFTATRKMLIMK